MQQPEPPAIPAAAASSKTLSVEELKTSIPLLLQMKENDPRFGKLIHLLQEVSSKSYDSSQKYQLMFKIIEIGNLFEILCSHIKNPKPTDVAKTCLNGVTLDSLKPDQQLALFQLARNVSADYFHAMYEDKTKEFFEAFSLLCKGQCASTRLLEVDDIFQKLSRGSDLKKVLGNPDEGKNRINKLFCQMGYFLKKAEEFLKSGNYEAAAIAFIAAGNAGRNFNFSGLNPMKRGSVTAKLYDLRSIYAHIHSDDNKNMFPLSERLMKFIEHGEIARLIGAIKDEAGKMNNPVDIDAYYAKKESSEASPRTYDSALLREPSSIAGATAASSSSQSPSAQVSRESQNIGSRPPESKRREEPLRGDKERHASSTSSSAPTSSSSSHRQSHDERQRDRERDRDRDRGRGDEKESRRSDDKRYEPPPRSSHGSSSSSSRYSERERYEDRRSSSSVGTESLNRSKQSQSSRAADEEEERRRAHDRKRAKGSSEAGCKDEALKYSKKDDSDDESRRHEKRHQPPPPPLGSGVSSTSTQRSAAHSEKSSSSSHTASSSHSDVRHESSSLSSHYGSSLGKPKDWHRVEPQHEPQPEKPRVKDSLKQMQAKRERPRAEEETPKEEQNASLKRRF